MFGLAFGVALRGAPGGKGKGEWKGGRGGGVRGEDVVGDMGCLSGGQREGRGREHA